LTKITICAKISRMITPPMCRAARGLLNWSQQQLADAAEVSPSTVRNFEAGRTVPVPTIASAIQRALESAGIEFIDDGVKSGRRQGPDE
jgi:transcriptional regulator with XRE-family HTH domain